MMKCCRAVTPSISARLCSLLQAVALTVVASVEVLAQDGRQLDWAVREVFSLGTEDSVLFGEVDERTVAPTSAGGLFVLDRQSGEISRFGPDGRLEDTFGGRGGGPDEFGFAWELVNLPGDNLGVHDRRTRTLRLLGETGDLVGAMGLPFETSPQSRLAHWRGGYLYQEEVLDQVRARAAFQRSERRIPEVLPVRLLYFREEGATLAPNPDTIAEIPPRELTRTDRGCVRATLDLKVFGPTLLWAVGGGTTVYTTSRFYEFTIESEYGALVEAARPFSVPSASLDLAAAELGPIPVEGEPDPSCAVSATARAEEAGMYDEPNVILGFSVSPLGRIMVQRRAAQGNGTRIDVFDPTGEFIGTLPTGFPMPAIWLSDNRFATTRVSALEVPTVHVFEIVP